MESYKAEKEFAFSCFDILMVYSPRAYPTWAWWQLNG